MVTEIRTSTATAVAKVYTSGAAKYSADFEAGLDSWASVSPAVVSWSVASGWTVAPYSYDTRYGLYFDSLRGSGVLVLNPAAASGRARRTVTGLTIGRTYRFSAWAKQTNGALDTAYIGVVGLSTTTPITNSLTAWKRHTYTFTATATSHQLELWTTVASGRTQFWDGVSLIEVPYVTSTVSLDVVASKVTLDERRTPYASAVVTVHRPVKADLTLLDPRSNVRVELTLAVTWLQPSTSPQTRTFDLYLHARPLHHSQATVDLVLQSDEAKLIDAGNATSAVNTAGDLDQISLRRIIQNKLDTYRAELSAGTADADQTVVFTSTNVIFNPTFENGAGTASATGVNASTGASAVTSVAPPGVGAYVGTKALRWTAAAGASNVYFSLASGLYSVTPGETYTFGIYLMSSVARSALVRLRFVNAQGTTFDYDSAATSTATTATGWTSYSVTAVAPEGAVSIAPFIVVSGNSAGDLHYGDAATLTTGATQVAYFDGSNPTDTYYSFAWSGVSYGSSATRTALSGRNRASLWQDPGEKDWNFLLRLVQAAGLRLFCDENRVWQLVNPATFSVAGTIALADTTNVLDADDSISREDDSWCDAVVIKYSWIDTNGRPQVAYDSASTGGTQLRLVEWNKPYPGPGAAAALLARFSGLGRIQSLDALVDLTATPGMACTTALPETNNQTGVVSKIDFEYAEQRIAMTVTPRDLA